MKNDIRDVGSTADLVLVFLVPTGTNCTGTHWYRWEPTGTHWYWGKKKRLPTFFWQIEIVNEVFVVIYEGKHYILSFLKDISVQKIVIICTKSQMKIFLYIIYNNISIKYLSET